jgi:phospholipase D1/2
MELHALVRSALRARWLPLLALLLPVALLAAAWRLTPLGDLIEPEALARRMREIGHSPWALFGVPLIYICANAVLVPNAALNVGTILALGAPLGMLYALYGSLCAGLLGLLAGRWVGVDRLRALEIPGIDTIGRHLRRSGFAGVLFVRLLPIAPFSVMNLTMGALRVRVRAFVVGTLLGLLPGALAVGIIGHRVEAMISDGVEIREVAMLAVLVATLAAVVMLLRRWLISRLQTS